MSSLGLDDLRFFLALARERTLTLAARRLGVSHTTVRRRVSSLEQSLGSRLFDKSADGWVLTDAGLTLFASAEGIEQAAIAALDQLGSAGAAPSGSVRVATNDAFGTHIMAVWLVRLWKLYPSIRVELVTSNRLEAFTSREFDIAVSVHRPDETPSNVVQPLTSYNLGLYASRDYLAVAPPTDTPAQMAQHLYVWFVESLLNVPELHMLTRIVPRPRIVAETNTVLAQQAAVAAGLGIGLLPCFAADGDARLVRVCPEVEVSRTYWLIASRSSSQSTRIKAVAGFLLEQAAASQPLFQGEPRRSRGVAHVS